MSIDNARSATKGDQPRSYAKSPLNYTGGKHKLLPKLVPLMPSDMVDGTFVDLFGGGGNVVANAPACFSHLVYNEFDGNVFALVSMFASLPSSDIAGYVDEQISKHALDKQNKDGYYALREAYNSIPVGERDPWQLFALVAHSFSNQIRFNRQGDFNLPFGQRTFNEKMRANVEDFTRALQSRKFTATSGSFSDFDFSALPPDSTFIYCDPPYLGSMATYNEHGGWTEDDEQELLNLLDRLDDAGYAWMLSNNFEYDNPILKAWAGSREHYIVVDLDYDYKSCNYHKNAARSQAGADGEEGDKARRITEVAIVNYPVEGIGEDDMPLAAKHGS